MTNWNGAIHPAAELFPMLPDAELRALADDIGQHGLDHPVVIAGDGTLLDGRNRRLACEMAGVVVSWKVYERDDHVRYIISNGLKRRELTTGQKAALAFKLLPMYRAEALKRKAAAGRSASPGKKAQKDTLNSAHLSLSVEAGQDELTGASKRKSGEATQLVAEIAGTSRDSVVKFEALHSHHPDLADEVGTGKRTLNSAVTLAKRRADAKATAEAQGALQEQRDDALLAQLAEQARIESEIRKAESERAVSDQLLDQLVQRVQSINLMNFNVIATSTNSTLLRHLNSAWNEAVVNIKNILEDHQ